MAIHSLKASYHLQSSSSQSGRSFFIIRDKDNRAIGKLMLGTQVIIDESKRMGTQGKCKWPVPESFPSRIVLDRAEPERKFKLTDVERKMSGPKI